jgi:hypothetical protein
MHDFEEPQISRRIAMVAHDNKKVELLGWAEFNVATYAIISSSPPAPPAPCSSTNLG